MIKLICCDLDGTLVNKNNKISHEDKKALIKAQKKGIKVALVTGRPDFIALNHALDLNLTRYDGALCSYNGSKITMMSTGEVINENRIDKQLAKNYLIFLEKFKKGRITICEEDKIYVSKNKNGFIEYHLNDTINNLILDKSKVNNKIYTNLLKVYNSKYIVRERISEILNFPPINIAFDCDYENIVEIYNNVIKKFSKELYITFTRNDAFEAMNKNGTKYKSIQKLMEYYGINNNEILAFGDSLNDIEMIKNVGIGVAMNNSNKKLKSLAKFITLDERYNGVSYFLQNILPEI